MKIIGKGGSKYIVEMTEKEIACLLGERNAYFNSEAQEKVKSHLTWGTEVEIADIYEKFSYMINNRDVLKKMREELAEHLKSLDQIDDIMRQIPERKVHLVEKDEASI